MDFLPVYFMVVINIFILYLWREDRREMAEERKSLYDRIMAPSLTDYKANTEPDPEPEKKEDEEIVEFEEAKEDIVNG